MNYYVYLLLAKSKKTNISYVGYTSNLINRLKSIIVQMEQNLQKVENGGLFIQKNIVANQ